MVRAATIAQGKRREAVSCLERQLPVWGARLGAQELTATGLSTLRSHTMTCGTEQHPGSMEEEAVSLKFRGSKAQPEKEIKYETGRRKLVKLGVTGQGNYVHCW